MKSYVEMSKKPKIWTAKTKGLPYQPVFRPGQVLRVKESIELSGWLTAKRALVQAHLDEEVECFSLKRNTIVVCLEVAYGRDPFGIGYTYKILLPEGQVRWMINFIHYMGAFSE